MDRPQMYFNKSMFADVQSEKSQFPCLLDQKYLNSISSNQTTMINSNESSIVNKPNYIYDDSILRQSNLPKKIRREFCLQKITDLFLNSQISIDELNKFVDLKFINSYIKFVNKRLPPNIIGNERFTSSLEGSNNSVDNKINIKKSDSYRVKFSKEEDDMLRQIVARIGEKNWRLISSLMPGRNQKQCRDRYKNYLAPNLIRSQWTQEEDDLLLEKYKLYGPKWSQIHTFLPNRTSNDIKNRYNYFIYKKAKNKNNPEVDNDFCFQNQNTIITSDFFYSDHFNFDNDEFQINDLF